MTEYLVKTWLNLAHVQICQTNSQTFFAGIWQIRRNSWQKFGKFSAIFRRNLGRNFCFFPSLLNNLTVPANFPMIGTKVLVMFTLRKTEKQFPLKLNGIWSWWQFSFRFWNKWDSIWLRIVKKQVTTIIFLGQQKVVVVIQVVTFTVGLLKPFSQLLKIRMNYLNTKIYGWLLII